MFLWSFVFLGGYSIPPEPSPIADCAAFLLQKLLVMRQGQEPAVVVGTSWCKKYCRTGDQRLQVLLPPPPCVGGSGDLELSNETRSHHSSIATSPESKKAGLGNKTIVLCTGCFSEGSGSHNLITVCIIITRVLPLGFFPRFPFLKSQPATTFHNNNGRSVTLESTIVWPLLRETTRALAAPLTSV